MHMGRNLWRSSGPTSCPMQDNSEIRPGCSASCPQPLRATCSSVCPQILVYTANFFLFSKSLQFHLQLFLKLFWDTDYILAHQFQHNEQYKSYLYIKTLWFLFV